MRNSSYSQAIYVGVSERNVIRALTDAHTLRENGIPCLHTTDDLHNQIPPVDLTSWTVKPRNLRKKIEALADTW